MRARVAVVAFLGCVRVWRRSSGRLQFSVLTCVCIGSVIDSLSYFNFLILMKKYSSLRMRKTRTLLLFRFCGSRVHRRGFSGLSISRRVKLCVGSMF